MIAHFRRIVLFGALTGLFLCATNFLLLRVINVTRAFDLLLTFF